MKVAGDLLTSRLKNPDILKRKPNLKICKNHLKDEPMTGGRVWLPSYGTAVRGPNGWYKRKQVVIKSKKKE